MLMCKTMPILWHRKVRVWTVNLPLLFLFAPVYLLKANTLMIQKLWTVYIILFTSHAYYTHMLHVRSCACAYTYTCRYLYFVGLHCSFTFLVASFILRTLWLDGTSLALQLLLFTAFL